MKIATAMSEDDRKRAAEILAELRALREREDDLQDELFVLTGKWK